MPQSAGLEPVNTGTPSFDSLRFGGHSCGKDKGHHGSGAEDKSEADPVILVLLFLHLQYSTLVLPYTPMTDPSWH